MKYPPLNPKSVDIEDQRPSFLDRLLMMLVKASSGEGVDVWGETAEEAIHNQQTRERIQDNRRRAREAEADPYNKSRVNAPIQDFNGGKYTSLDEYVMRNKKK